MKPLVIAVIVIAFGLTVLLTPQPAEEVQSALLLGELHNDRAEGAPQQTVVAAWTMRDLLAIQAETVDHRPAVLLTAAVLILGLGTLANKRDPRPTTPAPAPPTYSTHLPEPDRPQHNLDHA